MEAIWESGPGWPRQVQTWGAEEGTAASSRKMKPGVEETICVTRMEWRSLTKTWQDACDKVSTYGI